MNTSLIKSTLAMTAAFAVGSALATEEVTKLYGATFEDAADGINNDYAYTAGELVSIYSGANLSKWFAGSAEDQSTITDVDAKTGNQALKLQTEGGTLTNQFFSTLLDDINDARQNAKVRFEANVKFVASDTLDCGVEGGGDAKFALYAYAPDGGTTNLVIVHKYDDVVTNEVTDVEIDTENYTSIVVEYRTDTVNEESFFSVTVDGEPVISDLADDDIWFMTINSGDYMDISSLCFKGTGMVDDLAISKVEEAQNYTVTFQSEGVTIATTNVASGAVVVAPDPAPTKEHYHLTGWTLNGNGYDFATPVNADITLVADFAIDTHTLTINYTGADAYTPAQYTATLDYGAAYSVASPVIAGYTVDVATVSGTMGDADVTVTVTYSAQQQQADWDDPEDIPAGTSAATQYSELNGTALATADAKELTDWAKANNVDFSAVTAAPADYVDAFLLNCATADVDDEKAAFIIDITIVNGLPVVNPPAGKTYNGTLQLKGATSLTGTWESISEPSATYKFYKYELSLPTL